jgi:superfamily II DNA or RNA helicase
VQHRPKTKNVGTLPPLSSLNFLTRGWSIEQLSSYNRERFEDLISASWDLVIIDEAHRMGGSTDQVARYKLGAALAEAAPYFLLLSATPHQGKTDQFLRLMQLAARSPTRAASTATAFAPS